MGDVLCQELGYGISCIDANYVQAGMACFYLLQQGDEFAVIETGTSHSVAPLLAHMAQHGISAQQIRYVIPTHVHLDHSGGAGAMMAVFPQAQLVIHPRGRRHMAQPQRLIASAMGVYGEAVFRELYGEIVPVDNDRMLEAADGDSVELCGRRLEFRHTRGHANHHLCVWDAISRSWFSGDMFGVSYPWFRFEQGDFLLPSTTPTQFDPDAYYESLDLLDSYAPRSMYLTHYGELTYSVATRQLLQAQVQRYCALAKQSGKDATVLSEDMCDYTLDLISQFKIDTPVATQREWLQFDMQLNAQGLSLWVQQTS